MPDTSGWLEKYNEDLIVYERRLKEYAQLVQEANRKAAQEQAAGNLQKKSAQSATPSIESTKPSLRKKNRVIVHSWPYMEEVLVRPGDYAFELAAYGINVTRSGVNERNAEYTISAPSGFSLEVKAFAQDLPLFGSEDNRNRVVCTEGLTEKIYDYDKRFVETRVNTIALPLDGETCIVLVHVYGISARANISFTINFDLGEYQSWDGENFPPTCGENYDAWVHEVINRHTRYVATGEPPRLTFPQIEERQFVHAFLVNRSKVKRIDTVSDQGLQQSLNAFMVQTPQPSNGLYSKESANDYSYGIDQPLDTTPQAVCAAAQHGVVATPGFGGSILLTSQQIGQEFQWANVTPTYGVIATDVSFVWRRYSGEIEFIVDPRPETHVGNFPPTYENYLVLLAEFSSAGTGLPYEPFPDVTSYETSVVTGNGSSAWICGSELLSTTNLPSGIYETRRRVTGSSGWPEYDNQFPIPWAPPGSTVTQDFYQNVFSSDLTFTIPTIGPTSSSGRYLSDYVQKSLAYLCGDQQQGVATPGIFKFIDAPNYNTSLSLTQLIATFWPGGQENVIPETTVSVAYNYVRERWLVYVAPGRRTTLVRPGGSELIDEATAISSYPYPDSMNFVWDWGRPDYCRQQLLNLGFTEQDLAP